MTKKISQKQKAINKFKKCFEKTFSSKNLKNQAVFDHRVESIQIAVPLSLMEWGGIKPMVQKLMKEAGVSKYFSIGGAGTGFRVRDISLYIKE